MNEKKTNGGYVNAGEWGYTVGVPAVPMTKRDYIALQLGAAKARLQCLEEACIDGTQRRLAIYEINYWQSNLDELGEG